MKTPKKILLVATALFTLITVSCRLNNKIQATKVSESKIITKTPISFKHLNLCYTNLFDCNYKYIFEDQIRSFEFENQEVLINKETNEVSFNVDNHSTTNENSIYNAVKKYTAKHDIICLKNQNSEIDSILNDPVWMKNNLYDFSELPEFQRQTSAHLLTPNLKKQWGGIVPGPVISGNYYCLYYNVNIAKKIGLEIKTKNMTIDDFISYLNAVEKYNELKIETPIVPYLILDNKNALITQLYASLFDSKSDFDSEELAMKNVDKWFEVLYYLEKLSQYSNSQTALNSSICLFTVSNALDFNNKNNTHCEAQLPFIRKTKLYPIDYDVHLAVPKNATNKNEAIKFLLHLNSPDVAESWVKSTKGTTGIKFNANDLNYSCSNNFTLYIHNNLTAESYRLTNINSRIFGYKNKNQHCYANEVLIGTLTANQAKDKILNSINSTLTFMTAN